MNRKWKHHIGIIISLLIISFIISMFSSLFSTVPLEFSNLGFIFSRPDIFILNTIPVLGLLTILFFLINSLWISTLITGIVVLGFSFVNFLKISYRSEPLFFSDLKLVKETMAMQGEYSINLNLEMFLVLFLLIIGVIIIKKFFNFKIFNGKMRIIVPLITLIILGFSINTIYSSEELYNEKGEKYGGEIVTPLEKYMNNGFVYPFIYSVIDNSSSDIREYNKEDVETILSEYEYRSIPEDKKVNIIAVMLEAFSDFSEFEELNFLKDPYVNWHQLEENYISGKLLVNVFGGGTINTELSFLNGTYLHKNYLEDTNSYMWYFRNEGYDTYGMHPSNGWFYERYDTYDYLGAKEYLALENNFEEKGIDGYKDYNFFQEIIDQFEERKEKGSPQFNFSVTYQNHGPYPDHYIESNQFVEVKDHQDSEGGNLMNNYLAGIWDTDQSLALLINHFKESEEPVILIFFGDHKPWLGEGDKGYKTFGINTSLNNLEGYLNYYETPFVIFGNDSAKEMFSREFKGDAGLMSPHFLMNYLMNYLDLQGDRYNQYLTDITKRLKANTETIYFIDGEFSQNLNENQQNLLDEYFQVQYDRLENFKYENVK